MSSKSSPAASFDSGEFESVNDKTVKLSSTYNWDQTTTAMQPSASLDPNSDDFFNSMLADDKKVTWNMTYSHLILIWLLVSDSFATLALYKFIYLLT